MNKNYLIFAEHDNGTILKWGEFKKLDDAKRQAERLSIYSKNISIVKGCKEIIIKGKSLFSIFPGKSK
jgi:hypothetical protein